MNRWKTVCSVALPAFALGACAVMPQHDTEVENARAAVLAAQNDPQVAALAPVELSQAVEAMRRTDALVQDHGAPAAVHHLAYLAWARAGIATEAARLKAAESSIATANAERDRVQLEARAREAERAQRNAQLAHQDAQLAQAQADASRREASQAQQQAQTARQQAETAQARARSLESTLHELQARPTDRGLVVTLGDVLFDSGHAELRPGGMRAVDRLADFMREYPQRRVSIEGYTDSVGNVASNQQLSERRADAVRRALVERGIDPTRVIARGYGEEYPVASNANATGRQINRRVEIVISDERGMIGSRQAPPVATVGRGQRG